MNALPYIDIAYVFSGLVVGGLVGMTGVGGGSLMTPLLILLFGIAPEKAVATDLIYASITKTGGSIVHGFNRTIDWRVVTRLAAGSLPAALATLAIFYALGIRSSAASVLITRVLGVALLFTAVTLVLRPWLLRIYTGRFAGASEAATRRYTILTGLVLGVLVTISSVGAGALGVTALIVLYPRLPIVRIAGSDIAHAVPLTLVAGIGHLTVDRLTGGGLDPSMLISLLVGSLPGIVLASAFAPKLPDTALRLLLAATLALVGWKLLS